MDPSHANESFEPPDASDAQGQGTTADTDGAPPLTKEIWGNDEAQNDSRFWGLAATMAKVCEAAGSSADNILKNLTDFADKPLAVDDTFSDSVQHRTTKTSTYSPFVYQPLEGPMAIRILILHPGGSLEPLRGTIQHGVTREINPDTGFSSTPKRYEAISYVWGSESKPCSILLNGCPMAITQSLFDALVRFRHPHMNRRLWADGLCINQSNSQEKAAQVALMPEVYTYSARVLVHLGEQRDCSELLPELVQKIASLNIRKLREKKPKGEDLVSLGLPAPDNRLWQVMVDFFCRPWFTRIWIIQEVILARDVLFFCGDWELRWRLVAETGERFDYLLPAASLPQFKEYLRAQRGAAGVALMRGFQFTRSIVAKRLSDLDEDITSTSPSQRRNEEIDRLTLDVAENRDIVIRECRKHPLLFPSIERLVFGIDVILASHTSILKLLGIFSFHEASIPQDRLYALVALAGDVTHEDFPPSYDEHLVDTHIRFSRTLVEKGQGMDVLYHATNMSFQSMLRKLESDYVPSWTPDWTTKQTSHRHWLKLGWSYSQYSGGFDGRGSSAEFVSLVDEHPNLLKVSGSRLDSFQNSESIVGVSLADMTPGRFLGAAKQFFERSEQLMCGDPYFTREGWPEVQCQTLAAGHVSRNGNSLENSIQEYIATKTQFLNQSVKHPQTSTSRSTSWTKEWFGLMPDYAVCKTSRGYVGLVPEATSGSDEVFMLRGSHLPFVLRPILGLPGYYRFVGGCYMHGLMKGEAWKHVQAEKPADIFLY